MADQEISAPETTSPVAEKLENNITQTMGLLYGLGMMTFSAFNQMYTSYWNYFLTNAVGIDPTTMGTITSASSIVAWVFVFIAAIIVEKIWFRWGQYRSYLLLAPPFCLLFTLGAWTDWGFLGLETGSAAQIALIVGSYLAGQFFLNLFMAAGIGIIPAVSRTEADRTLLSARKGQFNLVVKLLFAAISLPMIIFFAGGDPTSTQRPDIPIGYTITALIWGVVFVAAFIGLFFLFRGMDPTEEYCQARAEAKKRGETLDREVQVVEKVSVVNCLKDFFTNIPALAVFLGEVGRAVYSMVLQSLAVYYCTAVFNDPRLYAGLMTLGNAVGLVGTFCGEFLGKTIGNRLGYTLGGVIVTVALVIGYFIASSSALVFTVVVAATFFGANMMMAIEYAALSNAIAYQEWKIGESPKAFIMSTLLWCPNIGKILQGIIVGWGLGAIGYSKDAVMTPELVQGITMLTFLIPAAVMGACIIAFFFMHNLDAKTMEKVNRELEERKQAKKADAAA